MGAARDTDLADDELKRRGAVQPQPNDLAELAPPQLALVGPTALDDIQRAIWRYGAEAVKKAVKEATKAKLGRKREPDMVELSDVINADALDWLAGKDPFTARSNYAIAKDFAERNPGHSAISTHKRIERKLSRGPYDRRWFTLVTAENLSRDKYPYTAHLRALEALTQLPETTRAKTWELSLNLAQATIADYVTRKGQLPDAAMSFKDVEGAVRNSLSFGLLAPLLIPLQKHGGLIGSSSASRTGLGQILSDALEESTRDGITS